MDPRTPSRLQPDALSPTKPRHSVNALHSGHRSSAHHPAPDARRDEYTVQVDNDDGGVEMRTATLQHVEGDRQATCELLERVLALRERYKRIDKGQGESLDEDAPTPPSYLQKVQWAQGNRHLTFAAAPPPIPTWEQFCTDIKLLTSVNVQPACNAACKYRLSVLEEKFNLYRLLNAELEERTDDKSGRPGGVYGSSTRVDNAVRLQAGMNAVQLLAYIQDTYNPRHRRSDEQVRWVEDIKTGKKGWLTVREFFTTLGVDPGSLTIDSLGLHPPAEKRFNRFNALDPELNRGGKVAAEVLGVFLSHKAQTKRFFGDLVRPLLAEPEAQATGAATQMEAAEYSCGIIGLGGDEWQHLAEWLRQQQQRAPGSGAGASGTGRNNWLVEIQRARDPDMAYEVHKQHLEALFMPLFTATLKQEPDDVSWLLNNIGGFTIFSEQEDRRSDLSGPPDAMPWREDVSDLYFAYHFWANLTSLNMLRKRKGLNTLQLRCVAGERSSQLDSLLYAYLLCDSVSNGLLMDEHPVLQYVFGLHGIGVAMSPLTNNGIDTPYMQNPFHKFFKRGLSVALCTDSPLHYHHHERPLLEEYATAAKLYKLSGVDVNEIARNSVLMSGFPHKRKMAWLGENYAGGSAGNKVKLSGVPDGRIKMREDTWAAERAIIAANVASVQQRRRPSLGPLGVTEASVPVLDNALARDRRDHAADHVADGRVVYPRIQFRGPVVENQSVQNRSGVASSLRRALELRGKYVLQPESWRTKQERTESAFDRRVNGVADKVFKCVEGVIVAYTKQQVPRLPDKLCSFDDFRAQMADLKATVLDNVHVKTFAFRRLQLLENRFRLHQAVSHSAEASSTEERQSSNRDFYQTVKVDTAVRMETGMTSRQLLNFILAKAKHNGDDIVAVCDGEPQTLRQMLQRLSIDPERLTVDDLNVQADATSRSLSEDFLPDGRDELLTLLLKTDNEMRGRYFAEVTKLTFEQFQRDQFTFAENRLMVYGQSQREFANLASWFDTHGMACYNNRWMIQLPRIYGALRRKRAVQNFAEYLENIFLPLWQVTLDPAPNAKLFHFLGHVSGFDCVEDESVPDTPLTADLPKPHEWTSEDNPPYAYYVYYVWVNIRTLNDFRITRNFSTFSFRPSCGEAGSVDHLLAGFLTANAISYGVNLKFDPVLQYLYYLAQVGIAVSPLSNNTKILEYLDNPFASFFRRGLNVSLATDSPLQYHHTQEPLIEEYSVASKVWKLSPTDMCEVARNSVLQSGFDHAFKQQCLGERYFLSSSRGNEESRTHLSDIRVAYRWETYHTELTQLDKYSGHNDPLPRALLTEAQEQEVLRSIEASQAGAPRDEGSAGIIAKTADTDEFDRLRGQCTELAKELEAIEKEVDSQKQQNTQLFANLTQARKRNEELNKEARAAARGVDEAMAAPLQRGYSTRTGRGRTSTTSLHHVASVMTSSLRMQEGSSGTSTSSSSSGQGSPVLSPGASPAVRRAGNPRLQPALEEALSATDGLWSDTFAAPRSTPQQRERPQRDGRLTKPDEHVLAATQQTVLQPQRRGHKPTLTPRAPATAPGTGRPL